MDAANRTVKSVTHSWIPSRLVVGLLATAIGACGGGGGSTDSTPPSVPQGLAANGNSTSEIHLSWQASTDSGTGVAGYRVYRDGASAPIATVTGTTFTDGNLTPSTTYTYSLRAFDGATPPNESTASPPISASTSPASGLDGRPANATCLAGDPPSSSTELAVERAFPNLPTFASPVAAVQAPGDASTWYVVEQQGRIRAFANQASVSTRRTFLDIASRVAFLRTGGELGLLGMAFHPDYPEDPRVFVTYTHDEGGLEVRLSQFRTNDGGRTLDPNSELVMLTVPKPSENHNGGNVAFGPDRRLYVAFGDGGSSGDPWGEIGNGQNLHTLLGKMLRLNVDGTSESVPYHIPSANPFSDKPPCRDGTGTDNCPEIHAYGFRNPWRWSFDRDNGELWVGDVGQNTLEEIDRVTRGGNYGWRCFEATRSFNATCGPNAGSSLPPVAQYGRTAGRSVTGGYVYRGSDLPTLAGRYVFADFISGLLWHIPRTTEPTLEVQASDAIETGLSISAFGEGVDGELLIVNYAGTLHRLKVAGAGTGSVPVQLTESGCLLPGDPQKPATGLVPYAPNVPAWNDGAIAERYLALPDGTSMNVGADGDLEVPAGSVLMQHLRLGERLVETRLLMRHSSGEWAGYTYEWNDAGTRATRVVGGETKTIGGQTWQFPSEGQCLGCHRSAAGRALGLELAQLNGSVLYPATARTANQIVTLNAIGMLSPAVTSPPSSLPAMPAPNASGAALNDRARAYLHTNCSHCHRPDGGTPVAIDLRYATALASMGICNATPQAGDLGLTSARIVAPGAPERSVLLARMNRRDGEAMPPLGSDVVDTAGVELIRSWIDALPGCM
jgi:uncharacterized repeat protein (TIGR03806 family)